MKEKKRQEKLIQKKAEKREREKEAKQEKEEAQRKKEAEQEKEMLNKCTVLLYHILFKFVFLFKLQTCNNQNLYIHAHDLSELCLQFFAVPTTEQILDRFLYDLKVSLRVESPVSKTKTILLTFQVALQSCFIISLHLTPGDFTCQGKLLYELLNIC